ncbi:alpha/beta hydrolase [Rhodosalinus sp. 5P4]|uniref:alpha/beta hydrolase n=1 Tax=Rhodosalinus sp. 5P4 TaxID=3239196 RepID=UPI003526B5D6
MQMDAAYSNSDHVPESAGYPPRWEAAAGAFRAGLGERAELGRSYGPSERQRLDLFHPAGAAAGLVVFVHGGYWKSMHRHFWSHLAAGPLARGWAVAMPSYDLCPEVRIADITRQIAAAVTAAAGRVAGPLRLTGHSAGGHLVARMCAPGMLPAPVAARLARVVPISALADLAPLMETSMNDILGIDAAEAAAESPVNQPPPQMPTTAWVGGAELPAFLDQARWLAEAWGVAWHADPGRHHFDVIDALAAPESDLVRELLA